MVNLKNRRMKIRFFTVLYILTCRWVQFSLGQICKFYHLHADCRYRVDGISMVQIQATINQCNDPVDVTFRLKCGNPKLDWQYTFVNSDEIRDIPGFDVEVGLQVKQWFKEGNKYMVEADFHVEEMPKADFMKEEIHLTVPDKCLTVNEGGKIAIGVLVSLVIIASVALVVILIIRWRRKSQALLNDMLVTNVIPPGQTNPPVAHFENSTENLQFTQPTENCDPVKNTKENSINLGNRREVSDNSSHERY